MENDQNSTHVAVIGAGPGGYAAAFMAADLGMKVSLIDTEPNPGGVCLYRGCIPSKALLHVAKVLTDAREAKEWGITFAEPKIDLELLRNGKDSVVQKMTDGLGQLCKARGVSFIRGRASFMDSTTLQITSDRGKERTLQCDFTILAPGSRPATLPDVYLESPRLMNSTAALQLNDIPKNMLIVGGGYIGLELGIVYASLRTQVTVVEMTPSLLPGTDSDLVKILAKRVQTMIHAILLNTKVVDMKEVKGGIRVKFEGPGLKTPEQNFEKVLVCVGRKPNSSGLSLNSTKVEVDKHGFVKVDEQRRTTDPKIFAIGDVAGGPLLAHKATHEGRVAAEVIAGHKVAFEPRAIPAVVFTDPEVAWCGLTESQARQEGRTVKVARFPWGASGRASTLHRSDGMTKIITNPETDQVLGVGIVGPGAGELISEGALAIEMGASAGDVRLTIHPHPTLGETIMESAEMIFGHSTHVYRPKRD
ncbi:MAG: dihydrolipoyl dehydrogenase [Candidatus Hydrogenedentes bacterium]|nr:dihydrolipoyl dehydrogenase [Candidatus Hydrogenedentota bacterium]